MSLVTLRDGLQPLEVWHLLAGMAAWAAGAVIAFRSIFFSSFDVIFGNRGDGRLIVYLHEHLYNALIGRAQFLSPPFFFPQQDVLGYTDAFLLDVPPYTLLRSIGLDPFLSLQIWAIILSLCCFMASLIIALRFLQLRWPIAVCAAVLITFPNNLVFKTALAHTQFFAVYYVPCILLLALWGVEDFPIVTRWSLVRVAIAAVLLGLLFSTAYYVAWLFTFTALISLCTAAITLRRRLTAIVRDYYRPAIPLMTAAVLGLVVGLVPLVIIYVPVLLLFHGRNFREYMMLAPFPKDIIDVSEWNMVWGWFVARLIGDGGAERTLAVTPGMTAVFLVLAYRLRNAASDLTPKLWQPTFAAACAMVWAFSWLLTAKIGTFSLFWLPYHLIPGANAIRAGERVQLLVNLWLVAGLAVLLQYWMDISPLDRRRSRILVSSIVLIFCMIEQINVRLPDLSRSSEFAWLSSVPEPPASCQAFLVIGSDHLREVDAIWISFRTDLPTINGVSGWTPPGWQLDDPRSGYLDAARRWIAKTGLKVRVCLYDIDARRWSEFG